MRSALGIFIFQSESFLAYQRQLEERHGRSNAQTILGIHEIPSDAQVRNILDEQPPSVLDEVYLGVLEQLENEKVLDQLRGPDGKLLVALDATEYFSSEKISCPNCSHTEKSETIRYHHSALLASLNSIAFLFHSVLETTNGLYRDIRQKITVRKDFFQHIKTLTIFHVFDSFDALIIFMIEGLKNPHPLPTFNSS